MLLVSATRIKRHLEAENVTVWKTALPQTEPLKKPKVGSKGFPRAGGGKIPKRKARPNQKTTQKKPRSAKFSRKIQKIS